MKKLISIFNQTVIGFSIIVGLTFAGALSANIALQLMSVQSSGGPAFIALTGASGSNLDQPDAAAFPTGDITISAKVGMAVWPPVTTGTVLGKFIFATQKTLFFQIASNDKLAFTWSEDGSADAGTKNSSTTLPFSNNDIGYVSVTVDVDTGASDADIKFWTSTDGISWSQLGATQTNGATTSFFDSTAQEEIGTYADGLIGLVGNVYWVTVHDNAARTGDPVMHWEATSMSGTGDGATGTDLQTGGTWTLNVP